MIRLPKLVPSMEREEHEMWEREKKGDHQPNIDRGRTERVTNPLTRTSAMVSSEAGAISFRLCNGFQLRHEGNC